MTEATERSISALIMMKVIAKATMIFSIESWKILIQFSMLKYAGAIELLMKIVISSKTNRKPSQLTRR